MRLTPWILLLALLAGCPTASDDDDATADDDDATADDDDATADDDDATADDDDAADDDDSAPVDDDDDSADPGPQFSFSNVQWSDAGGDGGWSVGEEVTISADMTNDWDIDHSAYPGGILTTDYAEVTIPAPEWWGFAIFAHTSFEVIWTATTTTAAQPGDVVTFEISASALNCTDDCPDPNPHSLEITLE